MNKVPAVWFPTVRTGTGSDVFTTQLVDALVEQGLRAEIAWLPLRAEYAPWSVRIPRPPAWANISHVNTWLHPRFIPKTLPMVATLHHAIHHPAVKAHKGLIRAIYHRHWIARNERRVMKKANQIVAVSYFAAQTAANNLIDLPIDVIYNGVNTQLFRPAQRARHHGVPFRILYLGSWKKLKGVDLLAPIMRELGDGFELVFTGGPAASKEISSMPPNMRNIGRLNDEEAVVAALLNVDVLIVPSRSEGFGLVAAEAMACGLPVVATNCPSLAEVVEHEVTGLLCNANDVMSFANAIRLICKEKSLHETMSRKGILRAKKLFNLKTNVGKYINEYSRLL